MVEARDVETLDDVAAGRKFRHGEAHSRNFSRVASATLGAYPVVVLEAGLDIGLEHRPVTSR